MIGHGGRPLAIRSAIFWTLVGVASYLLGVQLEAGQRVEDTVLHAAEFTYSPPPPLNLVSPPAVAAALLVLGVIAFFVHGIRRALVVTAVPAVAIVASQLLKQQWLTRPNLFEFDVPNTFPSGHMTVFAVFTAALIWAVPAKMRGFIALGGAALLSVVSWQLLGYGWHRPSDVFGGIALGTASFALACIVQPARSRGTVVLGRSISICLSLIGWIVLGASVVLALMSVWSGNDSLMLSAGQFGGIGFSALGARALLLLSVGRE